MDTLQEADQPRPVYGSGRRPRRAPPSREHALRLCRTQGYEETTVEQIADAAEVSPSTFFRYFPTKEDCRAVRRLRPLLIAAFRAQPPETLAHPGMRAAVRQCLALCLPRVGPSSDERGILTFTFSRTGSGGGGGTKSPVRPRYSPEMVAERGGAAQRLQYVPSPSRSRCHGRALLPTMEGPIT